MFSYYKIVDMMMKWKLKGLWAKWFIMFAVLAIIAILLVLKYVNSAFTTDDKITIITGASDNHFKSLCNFIRSAYQYADMPFKLYVYDLDLNTENVEKLKAEFPDAIYKKFDYSKYPPYFNIHVAAGEYAWKPVIINEVAEIEKSGVLIWCDAGNLFTGPLSHLVNCIKETQIYSPTSSDNIGYWTHIKMQEYFNIQNDTDLLKKDNRAAGFCGFNINNDNVRKFLTDYSNKAQIKDCIAPEGSSRENHRQDQALFTVLYYLYNREHKNPINNNFVSVSVHNDCG